MSLWSRQTPEQIKGAEKSCSKESSFILLNLPFARLIWPWNSSDFLFFLRSNDI